MSGLQRVSVTWPRSALSPVDLNSNSSLSEKSKVKFIHRLEGDTQRVALTIFLDGSSNDIGHSNEVVHREGRCCVGGSQNFLKLKNLRKAFADWKGTGS